MRHRTKGDAGEYEFTRAAYDELADSEKVYGVRYLLSLEMTQQKGVWLLVVSAMKPEGSDGMVYAAKWQGAWPNSQVVTYGAFLYQACHRVCRMVDAWHSSQEEDAARSALGV